MYNVGQKVRVIGDSFKADPHGLEIGTVVEIESISPATAWEEFPPLAKIIFAMQGFENVDLPERVHVKLGDAIDEYANLVFDDVELVDEKEPFRIRMLEDDFFDGFEEGDILDVFYSELEEEYMFIDNVGDNRPLDLYAHERI